MCHIILATILAVGVIGGQANDFFLCPDVQSEPLRGIDGRWFSIYRNYKDHSACQYIDIVNLGHDTFAYNETWQEMNREHFTLNKTIIKEADGNYYAYFINKEAFYRIDQKVMKVHGDFLFQWSCYVYENRTQPERDRYVALVNTDVYSKTPRYSHDIIDKISNWIMEKGLLVQPLTESRFDGCPTK
uniref:Venom protein n=1 Tax=Hemiscolopendra marginata TaxID=943146 RepID=A0A646QD50_9MYRI